MAPPFLRTTIGVPIDALRTRARFLAALSHEEGKRFLVTAIAKLREHMTTIRADYRQRKMTRGICFLIYGPRRAAQLRCKSAMDGRDVECNRGRVARPS